MLTMKNLIIISLTFLIVACGGAKLLHTELSPGTNLSNYKSFDFYEVDAEGDTMSVKFKERISMIQDAITQQLESKGFKRESDIDQPDLLVNIGIVVDEKVQTRMTNYQQDAPKYIGQRNYHWKSEEVVVGRYRMGTVTVDLVDPKKNERVWEGVVEDVIPTKEERIQEAIRDGIGKLFEKF